MKNQAFTVSQVNRYIANLFSGDFALSRLTVEGEISNLKYHSSGHVYFTLKDEASQISGIMFAGDRAGLTFKLEDGMKVLVTGRIGAYERGGSYQIYAKSFTRSGLGDLYLRFEELKKKLSEMGMFDAMYKKPVPKFARRIGIVTAPTGAAVHDIISIAKRRNPYIELTLYPAKVQGAGAAASVIRGIRVLDRMGLDVIIIGRGGGSLEDLWAFNEESLAQAVFDAHTPIISAVGHEPDVTISDYVADLRAPTPSAAAELAVYPYDDLMAEFRSFHERLLSLVSDRIHGTRQDLNDRRLALLHFEPKAVLLSEKTRSAELSRRMDDLMETRIRSARDHVSGLSEIRRVFKEQLAASRLRLRDFDGFGRQMEESLTNTRHRLDLLLERLESLSPARKLSSGFAYAENAENRRISSIRDVKEGEALTLTIRDGRIYGRVTGTEEENMVFGSSRTAGPDVTGGRDDRREK